MCSMDKIDGRGCARRVQGVASAGEGRARSQGGGDATGYTAVQIGDEEIAPALGVSVLISAG